ncbi:MAG TPA: DUF3618 domain-containing protein [Mycobacteriales bacterium]|nr:DUF3618 domain-containing protein [Mycobacteriales bacterium]
MAEAQDPAAIQREIEATRAELAVTIDAIADRVSPRRAAARGATRVKAVVNGGRNPSANGHRPVPGGYLPVPEPSRVWRADRLALVAVLVAVAGAVAFAVSRRRG